MKGILIDNDGLAIKGGDFVIGDTDAINASAVFLMRPGHAGNAPYIGVNIHNYKNASASHKVINSLKTRTKLSFKRDGAKVNKLSVDKQLNVNTEISYD